MVNKPARETKKNEERWIEGGGEEERKSAQRGALGEEAGTGKGEGIREREERVNEKNKIRGEEGREEGGKEGRREEVKGRKGDRSRKGGQKRIER